MNRRPKSRQSNLILFKAPGADWEYRTLPVFSTDALQEQVGGWIEFGIGAAMQTLVDRNPLGEFDLLCDEDGRAKRLPLNIKVPAPFAYGTDREDMLSIVCIAHGDLQKFLSLGIWTR